MYLQRKYQQTRQDRTGRDGTGQDTGEGTMEQQDAARDTRPWPRAIQRSSSLWGGQGMGAGCRMQIAHCRRDSSPGQRRDKHVCCLGTARAGRLGHIVILHFGVDLNSIEIIRADCSSAQMPAGQGRRKGEGSHFCWQWRAESVPG